jgi:hypothetical protein
MGLSLPQGSQTRMNLSKRLTGDFSATVRNRGKNYYWQGRVRIQHASTLSGRLRPWIAELRGQPDWEDGVLSHRAPPHFESDGLCKHLWATILLRTRGCSRCLRGGRGFDRRRQG